MGESVLNAEMVSPLIPAATEQELSRVCLPRFSEEPAGGGSVCHTTAPRSLTVDPRWEKPGLAWTQIDAYFLGLGIFYDWLGPCVSKRLRGFLITEEWKLRQMVLQCLSQGRGEGYDGTLQDWLRLLTLTGLDPVALSFSVYKFLPSFASGWE